MIIFFITRTPSVLETLRKKINLNYKLQKRVHMPMINRKMSRNVSKYNIKLIRYCYCKVLNDWVLYNPFLLVFHQSNFLKRDVKQRERPATRDLLITT